MLTVVLAVAVVGIALLAFAVLMDNTFIALLAIVLAVVGLVLLAREWLEERRHREADQRDVHRRDEVHPQSEAAANGHFTHDESLEPDMFEPDVAYEEEEEADAADEESAEDRRENEYH